ncbi:MULTISPECIES: Tn3 family transposase [Streptosporangium]|uniref:Beta-lactamase-related domain-containing protein n=1 Tax=Streptosporangium brasiliense TaxID=47480 RepID=A0ABT9RHZ2_9ACTN|nr:Tn3 family transposase [Streptosporangium brasiliense]MDP9868339.1 hypothetical protein [Streptosporangium brasiliense]
MIFGLVHLLGMQYRPALADILDQKGWRIQDADHGGLSRSARGKIDLGKIRRHWGDILRVVVSIYTGEIRAYDVMRMIQRDGNPAPLGEAIAHYRRIFKTLRILTHAVEEPYRRDIKGVRDLRGSRRALAGRIFHGKKGELNQRHRKGVEDRLGALGLVLNQRHAVEHLLHGPGHRSVQGQGLPFRCVSTPVAPPGGGGTDGWRRRCAGRGARRTLDVMSLKLMTAVVLMTAPAQAIEPPAPQGLGALVDEHVTTAMAEEKIPGVAVTVVAGGGRVVHKGYGWADAERRVPVDPGRTRFLIGSEPKLFTAQAALQLVRAGKRPRWPSNWTGGRTRSRSASRTTAADTPAAQVTG